MGMDTVDEASMVRCLWLFSFWGESVNFSLISEILVWFNRQSFSADIYLAQRWQDKRLTFPNMTIEHRALDVEWLNHIWHPDLSFYNAKSVHFQKITVPNHYLWLCRNDTLMHMMKLTVVSFCAMNFAFYPHDIQICRIQFQTCELITELIANWFSTNPCYCFHSVES